MASSSAHADNYTARTYVGFMDFDSTFATRVVEGDLFVGGKPVMVAMVGKELSEAWQKAHAQTEWFLGEMQAVKGMANFPFLIKASAWMRAQQHWGRVRFGRCG